MHEPPKRARKGIKKHVKQINELREFALKTRLIPENGFEETHSGIMPPPRFREYIPQWSPGFTRTDRSTAAGQTFFYFRRGGTVLVPYHGEELEEGEEASVTQGAFHSAVPIVPVMLDALTSENLPIIRSSVDIEDGEAHPVIVCDRDAKTVVLLEVTFVERVEVLGVRKFSDDSYKVGLMVDVPEADPTDRFLTGDTDPPAGVERTGLYDEGGEGEHDHSGEAVHTHKMYPLSFDALALGIELRNSSFAVHDVAGARVVLQSKDSYDSSPSDNGLTVVIPLGWFELDAQGFVIDVNWFAEGTLGVVKFPTGHTRSNDEPDREEPIPVTFPTEDEIEATTYTLPVGED